MTSPNPSIDPYRISQASGLHLMFAAPGTVSHRICGKRVEHQGKHPGAVAVSPPGVGHVYLND